MRSIMAVTLVAIAAMLLPWESAGETGCAQAEAKPCRAHLTGDLNGDGAVTSADLGILLSQLGHHAPGVATPVSSRSWGAIKLLYQ